MVSSHHSLSHSHPRKPTTLFHDAMVQRMLRSLCAAAAIPSVRVVAAAARSHLPSERASLVVTTPVAEPTPVCARPYVAVRRRDVTTCGKAGECAAHRFRGPSELRRGPDDGAEFEVPEFPTIDPLQVPQTSRAAGPDTRVVPGDRKDGPSVLSAVGR